MVFTRCEYLILIFVSRWEMSSVSGLFWSTYKTESPAQIMIFSLHYSPWASVEIQTNSFYRTSEITQNSIWYPDVMVSLTFHINYDHYKRIWLTSFGAVISKVTKQETCLLKLLNKIMIIDHNFPFYWGNPIGTPRKAPFKYSPLRLLGLREYLQNLLL